MPHTTHKTERKARVESTATTRPEQELFNESDLEARYRLKKAGNARPDVTGSYLT